MSLGEGSGVGFRGVVGWGFSCEKIKNKGKGRGWGAQALSKLPFSDLPFSFSPNYALHSRYRHRRITLELVFHNRRRHSCSLQLKGGQIADINYFGNDFDLIADTDTEKYEYRIISAMNLDKR